MISANDMDQLLDCVFGNIDIFRLIWGKLDWRNIGHHIRYHADFNNICLSHSPHYGYVGIVIAYEIACSMCNYVQSNYLW